jgi:hypothetical protein
VKVKLAIVILIIILLVVYYSFGTGYLKQRQAQKELTLQIADVTQTLALIPEPPQDLEQRLAIAQANLAAEQNAFPTKMNTTQVINTILELAADCEVKAIPLITQPWSTEMVGEHEYSVFRLSVVAEGSLPQLLTFISQLENGELNTLLVENLSVTTENQPSEEAVTLPVATLNLAIYARSTTSD